MSDISFKNYEQLTPEERQEAQLVYGAADAILQMAASSLPNTFVIMKVLSFALVRCERLCRIESTTDDDAKRVLSEIIGSYVDAMSADEARNKGQMQ